jgi:hypothetical protein
MDATVAAPTSQSLGSLIDEYYDLRERKRELDKEVKEVAAEMTAIEERVINALDADEVTMSRGRRASAAVTESEVPVVEDWDAFQTYVLENEALHLLERRASVAAWRELKDSGEMVPGTRPFKKRSLSVRKV